MKKKLLLLVITGVVVTLFWLNKPEVATEPADFDVAASSPRLASLLGADGIDGFKQVVAPRKFSFPQDHGPHGDYRNEWWYLTGNLDGENDERFGFEMTFFRFSLAPEKPSSGSAWRSNQVFMGHFAITDRTANQFRVASRYSRGAAGLAGARSSPFRVWLEDWELTDTVEDDWQLRAAADEFAIDLKLTAVKPPVLNGTDGLSVKSSTPGNASYYYSIPRLQTVGTVRSGEQSYRVTGLSWLDREWGSGGLSAEQSGWDWFAFQLDDGSELMFYSLRRLDGRPDVHSAGTFIANDGTPTPLGSNEVSIDVLDYWDSPGGGRYPMGWRIAVSSLSLVLEISPIMAGQELTTLVRYWEGAVDITGTREGMEISGRGYVELTGYADR